jgi:long-chain acyl-CoA synthetase
MLLADLLRPTVDVDPDRPALHVGDCIWTYGQLQETAGRLAQTWLTEGLEVGDRVALLLPNRFETLVSYLACFQAGLIAVPLDYRYRPPQINYALRHCGSRLVIAHAERQPELAECEDAREVDVLVAGGPPVLRRARSFDEACAAASAAPLPSGIRPDDLAVIVYTSGTTSRPKGATLSRAALTSGTAKFLARVPLRADDVCLVAAPITRPFALRTQVLPTLHAGGTVVLLERFTAPDYLAALRRPPAKTFVALIPWALHQVIHNPDVRRDDFAAVRLCICGGDRVPRDLHKQFHDLTGRELTEQCGMTETGMYALNPAFGRKKAGSIGLPMYGVQLCLVDPQGQDVPAGQVGQIIVSGPLAMDGYWNDTAQTRKAMRDGWVFTGDLGRFDEDGYLWFMGRKKDIIVHDGSNISPAEVEEALLQHPAAALACVVGVTDTVHGQNVHAFVTLCPQTETPDEAALIRWAEARLSRQMVPERIHIVSDLPRTGTGKIDRDRLHWQAEAGTVEV